MQHEDTLVQIRSDLEYHIGESHEVHRKLIEHDDEIAAAIYGPPKSNLEGGGRVEEEGMLHKINELYDAQRNGGLKVHLPWGRIIIALIGSVGAIVVAIIQSS